MRIIFTIGFLIIFNSIFSQSNPHIFDEKYNFIRHNENIIQTFGNDSILDELFQTIDKIMMGENEQIHIFHFGDSHIQADFFSGQIRRCFHDYFYGADGGRGFIFPLDVAGTNNPGNYRTKKTGTWTVCKNLSNTTNCDLGMAGMSITSQNENASLEFMQQNWNNYPIYQFDKIKIFHDQDSSNFSIKTNYANHLIDSTINREFGYTEYTFDSCLTSIKLEFTKHDSTQTHITFHGISLESSLGGITYSSAGVNGADVDDWLKCNLLTKHLLAIQPQLIIISLGTNDCYPKYFAQTKFETQYDELIKQIKNVLPHTPIILTTPSDNFRYKRYTNENSPLCKSSIQKVARENKCLVWDLFSTMGGLNSIVLWNQQGLTAKDNLHFARKGYELQGNLMFCAIIKMYDNYQNRKPCQETYVETTANTKNGNTK